jgi:hypothetical protein
MTYTQTNFAPSEMPNVWERYYTMPNGNVVTMSKTDTTDGDEVLETTYSVIIHTEKPGAPNTDWWDNVVKEVAYCKELDEAESVVALLLKGRLI